MTVQFDEEALASHNFYLRRRGSEGLYETNALGIGIQIVWDCPLTTGRQQM